MKRKIKYGLHDLKRLVIKESDFGAGFVYPLGLFIKHFDGHFAMLVENYIEFLNMPIDKHDKFLKDNPEIEIYAGSSKNFHDDYEHGLSRVIEMWANAASDHLYEMKLLSGKLKDSKLADMIIDLTDTAITMGHGFTNKMWTYKDYTNVKKLAFDILFETDKFMGAGPIRAKWN
jgi:hypothetical protein